MTKQRFLVSLSAVLALLVSSAQAQAPPARNFTTGLMTGAQEVPPRATLAHGAAGFHLDPTGSKLHFVLVVARIRNVVAAHIHSGAPGVNGPILVGLFGGPAGGGAFNGLLAKGTIVRGVTLTNAQFDALIAAMRSGNTYVNVHTNDGVAPPNSGPGDFPGGEIRGQVIPHP